MCHTTGSDLITFLYLPYILVPGNERFAVSVRPHVVAGIFTYEPGVQQQDVWPQDVRHGLQDVPVGRHAQNPRVLQVDVV